MCINCWHTSDDRHLSLLPFSAGDAMLPGEKRTLLLRDRKDIRLLERACKADHMIFGQLLLYSNFFEDGREACVPSACVPLLQVCEIREPRDAGGVEGAIWTAVKCVGRARLETEPRVQPRGFLLSQASAVPDAWDSWRAGGCQAGGGPAEDGCGLVAAQAEAALLEVRSLQDTCRLLERELQAICGSAPPPGGSEARGAEKGRLGSTSLLSSTSLLGYGDASRYTRAPLGSRLDTEVSERRAVLLQNGLDEAPSASLRKLHGAWGARSEREAQVQLASWAGFAWLSGEERLSALRSRSPVERLQWARAGLAKVRQRLATELALQRVIAK